MFVNRAGVQNCYQSKVKVGNWFEEQELNAVKIKDFLHRKATGQLLINQTHHHLHTSLLPVCLSHSRDGFVHIGDHVLLYSVATDGVLSVDPSERTGATSTNFGATTSTLTRAPVARNTFVVEAFVEPGKKPAEEGSPLVFGQLFRLRLNPKLNHSALTAPAYYLHSQPISSLSSSKVSRKQQVSFAPSPSFDTVFRASGLDIHTRFELEGTPIPANAELILVHAQTQQAVSSDPKHVIVNDFGAEYEICAHSDLEIKKNQGLYAELNGRKTTDIPFRKERLPNHFAFLTATKPEGAIQRVNSGEQKSPAPVASSPSTSSQPSSSAPSALFSSSFSRLRDSILSRGPLVLHHFSKSLHLLDPSQSESLPLSAFRHVLAEFNVGLKPEEIEEIQKNFSSAKVNEGEARIQYLQLIRELRGGEMNLRRTNIVDSAFTALDRNHSHSVSLSILEQVFNPLSEDEVKNGQKSIEAGKKVVAERWGEYASLAGGKVSREEFVDYYTSVSVYVEKDEEFVRKVEIAWGIRE